MSKIDDVAKLAKVSKGTVSNVFSGKRPTSESVRKRVFEAAKQLDYTPNPIARSLVTKKTNILGLKIAFAENRLLENLHIKLINGVLAQARIHNYRLLIDTNPMKDLSFGELSSEPVDGVIVMDPEENDKRLTMLQKTGKPFVVIGVPRRGEAISYVNNNNEEMMFNVTELLIEKGHGKILFMNAPEIKTVSCDRLEGMKRAYRQHEIPFEESFNVYKQDHYEESSSYGYKIVMEHFKRKPYPFTAIVTDTDAVAIGVLRAFKELEISVPDDVSIIALNNEIGHDMDPALSAVNLHPEELGREAVKLLMAQIEEEDNIPNRRVIIPAEIIERQSCKNI